MKTMSAAPDRVIKILLVDDHAMFREGLARMLATEQDLEVIGEVSSAREGLTLLNSQTDVVLLDVDLGRERALEFVERAKSASFQGRILVVTAGISGREAVQLVQAGVAGILHKNHPTKVLCGAIRKVMAGEACMEDEYLTFTLPAAHAIRTPGPGMAPILAAVAASAVAAVAVAGRRRRGA